MITVSVPWSVGRTEFTSRFERSAIALLGEMSIAAVARRRRTSYLPAFLEPRRTAEKALAAVIQEAYIHGVKPPLCDLS